MNGSETEHEYGTEPASASADPILELRLIIYGLGVLLLLMSLAMNLYIRKQNSNIKTQLETITKQVEQIEASQLYQQNRTAMGNLIEELKAQTATHPEAVELLARYGIQVSPRPNVPKLE